MGLQDLRDQICIVGVGDTQQGSVPTKTGDELAIDAARAALQDCGLEKDDIDGLFVQPSYGRQGDYLKVGLMLGLNPRVGGAVEASGATGCYMIQHAALLLHAGMANYVLLVYGTNQKTNRNRFGGALLEEHAPYGAFNPSLPFAFAFRRHMHLYGTTEEQLATIAINQRHNSLLNPKAVQKTPISLDDYMNARYIVAPLRMFDYCYVTDGGHAFVLTTADRAKDLRKPPVYIRGMGRQEAFRAYETPDLVMQSFQQERVAKMVFPMADMTTKDIQALYVQDAYSPAILAAIENYGFCPKGEGGRWIQGGRIAIDGELPINANGGQLSETYMVGWQNTCDAVRQLRGECGPRQIKNVERIMCTYTGGLREHAGALILRR
ncbi:MAG: thiolase family protein [Deltaproteobacteria bacterium]|nr:thiolase family protein [Deltaproteobacteria bacterium]